MQGFWLQHPTPKYKQVFFDKPEGSRALPVGLAGCCVVGVAMGRALSCEQLHYFLLASCAPVPEPWLQAMLGFWCTGSLTIDRVVYCISHPNLV